MEIYPSVLRTFVTDLDLEFDNEHERDAVLSAAVMWLHRERFADLSATDDAVTMLEGDVWDPTRNLEIAS